MRKRIGVDLIHGGDIPLDEDTQAEVIAEFELQAAQTRAWYRGLYTLTILAPTPAFLLASHARARPALALQAIVSISASAYSLYYLSLSRAGLYNLGLALVIALQAFTMAKEPFAIQDLLWLLPLTSSITALVVGRWNSQVNDEIARLDRARFKVKKD